jgi:hypothetical protein
MAIRMMMFVIILIGAAAIAVAASFTGGGGAIVLNAVVTVVTLQIGYAAGLILRAALRAQRQRSQAAASQSEPVRAPANGKRH